MPTDLGTSSRVTIDAPPGAVWHALTDPASIARWFFGVTTETTWEEGTPIVHTGQWQGKPYEDKGTIVRVEPERLLVHTHWSPISGTPDREEHHEVVTWELREIEGGTELTVSETNLPSSEAKAMSERTWPTVLTNLKEVVETPDQGP